MSEPIHLTGLSWGHRRASGPLEPLARRFAELRPDIRITWSDRTLAGFEHQNIADAAASFDLIIYDHPFSGDIAAGSVLLDLAPAMPELVGREADLLYIGPSLATYRTGEAVWGGPIDAATEHAVYRADLLDDLGESVPECWDQVLALGRRARAAGQHLGMAVVAPHTGLLIAALMANGGQAWTTDRSGALIVNADALSAALDRVMELAALCPADALAWNSIDVHEAMVARDDIVYAPCVYGYATYGEADTRRRLSFAGFPGVTAPFVAGNAIGGTALGVSARSRHPEAALAFVRFALSAEAQDSIIPAHHGQPARRSAWTDPAIDARFNGYFSAVRPSIEQAWVRPRFAGYIPFQHEAGSIAARLLRAETDRRSAVDAILRAAENVGEHAP